MNVKEVGCAGAVVGFACCNVGVFLNRGNWGICRGRNGMPTTGGGGGTTGVLMVVARSRNNRSHNVPRVFEIR